LHLLFLLLQASSALYKTFVRPRKNLKKLGNWAVITGATDGIGKAYALALAAKGLNVMLISRTEAKLQDVQKEIQAKHKDVEIRYVVCDYSNFDTSAKTIVQNAIKDLDIAVLINNVGVSYRYPQYYHEITDEEAENLITMNINSTVAMTRMVLPGMVERKRGAIINISSASSMYTLPLLAGYSGAKSFVEKFSRALNAEYASKFGITCQCQIPFYVATKLAKMRPSFMVPTPEQYVKLAVGWIGYPDAVVSPYWPHALQGYILSVLPDAVTTKIILNMHLATRKRGMKKDESLKAPEGKKDK